MVAQTLLQLRGQTYLEKLSPTYTRRQAGLCLCTVAVMRQKQCLPVCSMHTYDNMLDPDIAVPQVCLWVCVRRDRVRVLAAGQVLPGACQP